MAIVADQIEYGGYRILRNFESSTGKTMNYEVRDGMALLGGPFDTLGEAKDFIDRPFTG